MGLFKKKKLANKIGQRINSTNKKVNKKILWCMHYWEFKTDETIRSTFNRELYEKILQVRYEM